MLALPKDRFSKDYKFNLTTMNFPFMQQVFVGLVSLIDPPRDSVPDAVFKCKAAGIKVVMVTGDQPVTATAIARQCNIITEKTANEIADEEDISLDEASKKSNAIVIHGDLLTKIIAEEEGDPEKQKNSKLLE
jgi:sodium/potassium-transporting ATPase subunit alpha